nr:MAG TPA: hypothetical protein [Caudoviricetes sp.]
MLTFRTVFFSNRTIFMNRNKALFLPLFSLDSSNIYKFLNQS